MNAIREAIESGDACEVGRLMMKDYGDLLRNLPEPEIPASRSRLPKSGPDGNRQGTNTHDPAMPEEE